MLSPNLIPLAVTLLAAMCAMGMVVALFYSHLAKHSASRKRFATIASTDVTTGTSPKSDEIARRKAIDVTLRELDEKQKARKGTKPSLAGRMRQAGLSWNYKIYCIACVGGGAASFLVAAGIFGISLIPAIGFSLSGGMMLPHLYVNAKRKRRLKKFSAEFPNAVDIIVRGVKAGLPLVDCLRIISTEAQEPVRSEFKVILEDQTLGLPMDQAVQRLPERIPLAEANFFGIVIALQSRTGGSLSEALGNLSRVLRERKKMQAKIKAVSSEAKASAGIIGSLPVAVTMLIYITSPDYITLLFTTLTGNLVLAASGIWMLIGCLVMRKMINFDF
jgi:tight adherence protein B